jgi:Late exocytosis, associated with Golgi transport/Cytosolic domain of 10TM putative phosphate transporter
LRWLEEDENDNDAPEEENDSGDSSSSSSSSTSSSSSYHNYWASLTDQATENSDFDTSNLIKADELSVNEVLTSFYFNAVVFCLLMCFYEGMRRVLPAVYSSRRKRHYQRLGHNRRQVHRKPNEAPSASPPPPPYPLPPRPLSPPRMPPISPPLDSKYQPPTVGSHSSSAPHQPQPQPTMVPETPTKDQATTNNNLDETINTVASEEVLPEDRPLDWILSAHSVLFGVSWTQVRHLAGLDGYFFLRFIRMNVRITAVSTVWFFLLLIPLYASGDQVSRDAAEAAAAAAAAGSSTVSYTAITSGWYHLSAANLPKYSAKMWVPCIVLYLFTAFIFFVVKQEYRHYLEIRQDFLAKGTIHVHPQHHYSVMVENIPQPLRSDKALAAYFDKLFPNTVHSAVMVWKLPALEAASKKCYRSCRRLEKSIAYWYASDQKVRPTHIVGRGRVSILGIDLAPLECAQPCTSALNDDDDDDEEELDKAPTPLTTNYTALVDGGHGATVNTQGAMNASASSLPSYRAKKPPRGTRVDSIAYYTQELAAHSRNLFRMQQRHASLAAKRQTGDDNSIITQSTDQPNPHLAHTLLDQDQSYRLHPPTNKTLEKSEHRPTKSVNSIGNLVDRVVRETSDMANQIMDDSVIDNALVSPSDAYYYDNEDFYSDEALDNPRAAVAGDTAVNSSLYGSISGTPMPRDGNHVQSATDDAAADDNAVPSQQRRARLMRRRG